MTTTHYLPEDSPSQQGNTTWSGEHGSDSESEDPVEQDARDADAAPPPGYTMEKSSVEDVHPDVKECHYMTRASPMVGLNVIDDEERHALAIRELTARPARPPPFPNNLPKRTTPDKHNDARARRRRRIILTSVIGMLAFVLITIIIILGVLLGIAKQSVTGSSEIPVFPLDANQTTITTTATQTVHETSTLNLTMTVTATTPPSTLLTSTMTLNPSAIQSALDSSFTIPTTQETCPDEAQELFISPLFCTFLSSCNSTIAATEQAEKECVDFCRVKMTPSRDGISFTDASDTRLCKGIDSFIGDAKQRVKECCGKCGCF